MWFKMAPGCERISIAQQEFASEFTDAGGANFFRAPDHFAGLILDLGGFAHVSQPEGAPEDLLEPPPARASALQQVSAQVDTLRSENENLRALLAEMGSERDSLLRQNAELQKKIDEAEEAAAAPAVDEKPTTKEPKR